MDGISIYNGTNHRIFISVSNTVSSKLDSGWIDPLSHFKPKVKSDQKYIPGAYRICSEIVEPEENVVFETSVNINLPSEPIKIETDAGGNFWWKIYKGQN